MTRLLRVAVFLTAFAGADFFTGSWFFALRPAGDRLLDHGCTRPARGEPDIGRERPRIECLGDPSRARRFKGPVAQVADFHRGILMIEGDEPPTDRPEHVIHCPVDDFASRWSGAALPLLHLNRMGRSTSAIWWRSGVG